PPAHGEAYRRKLDQSRPAWRIMPHIVGWRAQGLGEDLFLVDVNESVPEEILDRAATLAAGPKVDYEPLRAALSAGADLEKIRRGLDSLDVPAALSPDDGGRRVDFIAEELWNFSVPSAQVSAIVGPLVFCVSAHSHSQQVLSESLRYHLK